MKTALTLAALTCATAACGDAVDRAAATPETVAQRQAPIVMGREARQGETLSTVALIDPSGDFFCTGTLIAPTVVISAAHCLAHPEGAGWITPADVRVGIDALTATPVPQAKRVDVARLTVHPEYAAEGGLSDRADGVGRDNDIAVLVLARPAQQAPTPILPAGMLDELRAGAELVISGYGVTHLDPARDRAGRLHIGETPFLARSAHEFIAGGDGVTDTCNGDSGGPAYLTVGGERYLVGATSRAAHDADADCGDRGIYTLVPAYQAWIDAVVAGGAAVMNPPPAEAEGEWPAEEEEGEWAEEEGEWAEEEGEWAEGDGEPDADVCAEEGWYGDDVCDDFCDRPDPDCEGFDDEAEPEAAPEPDAPEPEPAPEPDAPEPEAAPEPDAPEPEAAPEPDAPEPEAPEPDAEIIELTEDAPLDLNAVGDGGGCSATVVGQGSAGWSMLLPLLGLGALRRRRRG